jgi:hypothetical protein
MALNGFHDDDCVIDYDSDGQHQAEHARDVDREGKPVDSELHHLIQQGEAQLAQVFAAAAATGEVRAVDPELAALTVSELTRGLMERRLRGWNHDGGPADAEFALDVVCRALAATPPLAHQR